jgi:ribose transport system permease protein
MARLAGVLLMVVILYALLMGMFPFAFTPENHKFLTNRLGFYGILTLGAGILIITGGIDLSIGSMVALTAVTCGLLMERGLPPVTAAALTLSAAGLLGVVHGLLVTRLRLQPFLVTLCGLFIYRGVARFISGHRPIGLPADGSAEPLRGWLISGDIPAVSSILLVMLAVAAALTVLLHYSVYGRYFFAIGSNKQAARYAGIPTDRYEILAYVICATLAGLGGVLFLLDGRSAQPTTAGSYLELYAITGAVLGGCSLRGGEGNIAGMVLGAAVLPLLYQICNFHPRIGSELDFTVIGTALLLGTIGNELVARRSRSRAAA